MKNQHQPPGKGYRRRRGGGAFTPPPPTQSATSPGQPASSLTSPYSTRNQSGDGTSAPPINNIPVNLPSGFLAPAETKAISNDIDVYREQVAEKVAGWVLLVFGISLLGAFVTTGFLIAPAWNADTATFMDKVIPALANFLEPIRVVSAIFSPLLAFILGYYFSLSIKSKDK